MELELVARQRTIPVQELDALVCGLGPELAEASPLAREVGARLGAVLWCRRRGASGALSPALVQAALWVLDLQRPPDLLRWRLSGAAMPSPEELDALREALGASPEGAPELLQQEVEVALDCARTARGEAGTSS